MKLIVALLLLAHISFADIDAPENLTNSEKVHLLWSQYTLNELDPIQFHMVLNEVEPSELSFREELQILTMKRAFASEKSKQKVSLNKQLSFKEALYIASQLDFFGEVDIVIGEENKEILEKAKNYLADLKNFRSKSSEEILDLVNNNPDLSTYADGAYLDSLTLFLFCRHDRSYPCLFIMKDSLGSLVRNEDGSLWSLPALGHSRHGRPFYITNGDTPSGVHSIDSVMPEADRPQAFGKFRRAILNWIPEENEEERATLLLPSSALDKNWWKEAGLARDNGRQWLRIHGTGNLNTDPNSHYYPHFATSGCISTREGKYGAIEYTDQRKLLDKMMESMQFLPVYSNEVKVKGLLYVIELDDVKAKVDLETLKNFGLE